MPRSLYLLLLVTVAACDAPLPEATEDQPAVAEEQAIVEEGGAPLEALLAAQPEDVQARYKNRHPRQTLEFFGIEPGMTVLEGLPGQGWYTKILLQYLGKDGTVVAADYAMDIWPHFPFGTEEFLANRAQWPSAFLKMMAEWRGENGAGARTFVFGSMPDDIAGTVDVVFFPRVLHNLAAHGDKRDYLGEALNDAHVALKPGGIFGVVQHEAREDMPDGWANGSHGYLKKSFVIEQAEMAGFEFVAASDINENEKDQPSLDDVVWRLPPSLRGSEDDPELRAAMQAIGESHRMTLKFRKPAS